ncbi:hypothetical protein [Streptomyces sp. H39-S7]|uniref:hypothetical protein n=1 Tax=Streptomyces sp. H39-S7 TaxID=3004357 RepID=UPI0022AEFCCD|nr:hypothetical protein [Streptomyces sp. H39-S7]MCZ4122911.1 hypothetical protein [Streptomyces sp. H39-S7]
MNGPGIVPPQPNDGARTGLRVVFVLLAVMSCGMLAWTPLLRIAILRRRNAVDWVLCGASFLLTVVLVILLGEGGDSGDSGNDNSPRDNAVVSILVIQAIVVAVYYLVTDIRHFQEMDAQAASRAYGQQGRQQFPYGAARTQHQQQTQLPSARADYNPYRDTPTPGPAQPPTPIPTPVPAPDPTATPVPTAGPAGPPAPRIDQVRAELDELSDYLRKEEGR